MNWDIVVSNFELQSFYYVRTHGKGMNYIISLSFVHKIVPILFFYKGGLGIKKPTNLICQ